jgi:Cdc6-like AAA superfamily ATPase
MDKLVLAGSYEEFLKYCRENNVNPRKRRPEAYFIYDEQMMCGRMNFEVIRYGTWYERDEKLKEAVKMREHIQGIINKG